ncbi:hypothetical protein [Salipiger sp.]|uniref:hypothetical protein n=1 Tax=Salipiger sp. TaxID=2078585 RepID=UPI003A96DF28
MTTNMKRRGFLAGAAAAALMPARVANAAEADFSGRRITFWTSHQGADSVLSLQTWSNYIAKYLPGRPEILVQSKFGAGGLTLANYFWATGKPDGLEAAMLNTNVLVAHALKMPGTRFDLGRFPVFAAETQSFLHVAGRASELTSEAPDPAGVGQQTYGTRSQNVNVMAAEVVFDAAANPLKVVTGFGGTETIIQALANGELDMSYVYTQAWLRNADNYLSLGIKPLFQMGVIDASGAVIAQAGLEGVPTILDIYLKTVPEGRDSDAYRALRAAIASEQLGKGFFLARDTPPEIVEAWRLAADAAARDPEFIAEHTRLLGFPLDYVPSDMARALLDESIEVLSAPFFRKGAPGYAMIVGNDG